MLSIQALLNPAEQIWARQSNKTAESTSIDQQPDAEPRQTSHTESREASDPSFMMQNFVRFAPYENFDVQALGELVRFNVKPLRTIRQNYEHFPYKSSKKDLFSKTGRESFTGTT